MAVCAPNEFSIDLLDRWVRYAVLVLHSTGVQTYESCQGGRGHAFPDATVRFEGSEAEAFRAVQTARSHGLPVYHLRRFWRVTDTTIDIPAWEITFYPRTKLIAAQRRAERVGYPVHGEPPCRDDKTAAPLVGN